MKDGIQFTHDWFYSSEGNLRPEVAERIHNLNTRSIASPKISPSRYELTPQHPFLSAKQHLINNTTKGINNSKIAPESKNYLKTNRGKYNGYQDELLDENAVMSNHGRYFRIPDNVGNTATHEMAHTSQTIGRADKGKMG